MGEIRHFDAGEYDVIVVELDMQGLKLPWLQVGWVCRP